MKNFPNTQKFVLVLFFIFYFTLFNSVKAQITACPYPITNSNSTCSVNVSYEYVLPSCACPSGCGPLFFTVDPLTSTFLPDFGCCASAVDVIIHIDGINGTLVPSPTPLDPFTCVSGGCAGWNTTHSISDPSGCYAAPGTVNITWTPSGATITP